MTDMKRTRVHGGYNSAAGHGLQKPLCQAGMGTKWRRQAPPLQRHKYPVIGGGMSHKVSRVVVTNKETMDQDGASSERRRGVTGVWGVRKGLIEKVMSELRQKDLGRMS